MVTAHDRTDESERTEIAAEPLADDRVLLHQRVLVGREAVCLEKHGIWNANLPDVVQIPAALEGGQCLDIEPNGRTKFRGVLRQALTMPVCPRVAGLDGHRQTSNDGLRRVQ